jgi:hypothetical protein
LGVVGVSHRDGLAGPAADAAELTVVFVDPAGRTQRGPITQLADAPLEEAAAVRKPASYRGQRSLPGLWWSVTAGRHLWYQSRLGRDQAIVLDFDPRVRGLAGQPFRLEWRDGGRGRSHVPAWFARLEDGGGLVVDCRPADQVGPASAYRLAVTARACAAVGWRHVLVHGHDRVRMGNLRWLAAYRHPRYLQERVAAGLLARFAEPGELLAGAAEVGDPIAVLPVLYHLLWRWQLRIDLRRGLHDRTVVSVDHSNPDLAVAS